MLNVVLSILISVLVIPSPSHIINFGIKLNSNDSKFNFYAKFRIWNNFVRYLYSQR